MKLLHHFYSTIVVRPFAFRICALLATLFASDAKPCENRIDLSYPQRPEVRRKISDEAERRELRRCLLSLNGSVISTNDTEDLPKCVAGIVRGGRDSFYSLNLIDHPVLGPVDLWQILFFANGTRYSTYPACFGLSPKGYAFNYIGGMAMTRISHLVFAESRVRYMGCVCTTNRFGSSKCDCPFERMEIPCSRSALLRALGDREILVSERGNSIYVPDCDLVALCREGSSNDIDCVGIFLGGAEYPFEGCGCRLPPSLARLKEMRFRIRLDEGAELASLIGDMSKMSVEEMDAHVDSLRKRIVVKESSQDAPVAENEMGKWLRQGVLGGYAADEKASRESAMYGERYYVYAFAEKGGKLFVVTDGERVVMVGLGNLF